MTTREALIHLTAGLLASGHYTYFKESADMPVTRVNNHGESEAVFDAVRALNDIDAYQDRESNPQ